MLAGIVVSTLALMSFGAPDSFPLWKGDAPGALGKEAKDIPTLTVYRPEHPNGTAVVVCPGGGYYGLTSYEGNDYAVWLNRYGITAFVLKYRLGSNGYRHPVMLWDAQRAIRTVRSRSSEWGVDSGRIGIIGSSAGGHLAATAATHFDSGNAQSEDLIDRASSRPDFAILCYAVITMGEFTHAGSRENLLGKTPDPKLVDLLSNEKQVTKDCPPCFVWHTVEDAAVPVEISIDFARALRKAGVPFELHLYEKGGHGMGLAGAPDSEHLHPWTMELLRWLREHNWATK